jgi:hypothetical protein
MKFAKYLDEFNVNISALARKIGVSPSYLCDVKMGRRMPNDPMKDRIAEATNNKVKSSDWVVKPKAASKSQSGMPKSKQSETV